MPKCSIKSFVWRTMSRALKCPSNVMPVSSNGIGLLNRSPPWCFPSRLRRYRLGPVLILQFPCVSTLVRCSQSAVSLRTLTQYAVGLSSPSGSFIAVGAGLPVDSKFTTRGVHSRGGGGGTTGGGAGGRSTSTSGSAACSKLPSCRLRRQRPSIARATFAGSPSEIARLSIFLSSNGTCLNTS